MSITPLRIVRLGWATTVQDLGRPGMAHVGVPRAGAVDRSAFALANRLVGNPPGAAALETAGGLVVEAAQPLVVATSGDGCRHTLAGGARLAVAPTDGEMWGYLAVRGGIDVDPVLGSRSHDTLSGVGPPPLGTHHTDSTVLAVGPDPRSPLTTDLAPIRARSRDLRVWPGPRCDWFDEGIRALTVPTWYVAGGTSRIGVRLSGATVPGAVHRSLPSEGLVEGAVQITHAGDPIVMLANHPTTGGYPVIAVVDPADLPVVAQSPPGSELRFHSP